MRNRSRTPFSNVALCQTASVSVRAAVLCKIVVTSDQAPDWVMLFPASDKDGEIKARDGRKFKLTSVDKFVADFNAEAHDVPFDLEHASELLAPEGKPAPAVGWITQLENRNGAVWGAVDWTTEGASIVQTKKYRYASPAFKLGKAGEVLGLVSAGLTNRPALVMPALASTQINGATMTPELLKLLGLDATATPEQIAEATKKLADAQVKAVADVAAASAAHAAELTRVRAESTPTLANFVPRADYDAALTRVAAIEKKIEDEKLAAHTVAVASAIDEAMKLGKITPATKDYYVSNCSTPASLEAFRAFVKGAPTIAPDSVVSGQPPVAAESTTATASDISIAERCGVTKEQFLAAQKA